MEHFDNATISHMEKQKVDRLKYKSNTKDRSYLEYVMAYNRVTEVKDNVRKHNESEEDEQ